MDINFPKALAFVLRADIEGGNDDDPEDSGGRTSRGITQREYNAYCSLHHSNAGDVWNMSAATCEQIYHVSYWNPFCGLLPSGLDLVFFDEAVNAGPHEAILILQRVLGVKDDGHFGVVTADEVVHMGRFHDTEAAMDVFTLERKRVYREMKQFRHFGKGWLARADKALAAGKELLVP